MWDLVLLFLCLPWLLCQLVIVFSYVCKQWFEGEDNAFWDSFTGLGVLYGFGFVNVSYSEFVESTRHGNVTLVLPMVLSCSRQVLQRADSAYTVFWFSLTVTKLWSEHSCWLCRVSILSVRHLCQQLRTISTKQLDIFYSVQCHNSVSDSKILTMWRSHEAFKKLTSHHDSGVSIQVWVQTVEGNHLLLDILMWTWPEATKAAELITANQL